MMPLEVLGDGRGGVLTAPVRMKYSFSFPGMGVVHRYVSGIAKRESARLHPRLGGFQIQRRIRPSPCQGGPYATRCRAACGYPGSRRRRGTH